MFFHMTVTTASLGLKMAPIIIIGISACLIRIHIHNLIGVPTSLIVLHQAIGMLLMNISIWLFLKQVLIITLYWLLVQQKIKSLFIK